MIGSYMNYNITLFKIGEIRLEKENHINLFGIYDHKTSLFFLVKWKQGPVECFAHHTQRHLRNKK